MIGSQAVAEAFFRSQLRSVNSHSPPLSLREQAILFGLATGMSRKEIADTEHLSLRTVERIVYDLEIKLEARTAFVLGMKAAELGLLNRPGVAESRQPTVE